MKTCSKCGQQKTHNEFSKWLHSTDGLRYQCKSCDRKYRVENRERIANYLANYYAMNKENMVNRYAEYRAANKEKNYEYYKTWKKSNREKIRAANGKYSLANKEKIERKNAAWREKNSYKMSANCAAYRAKKRNATTNWSDEESIKLLYAAAKSLSVGFGIKYHVDHIVPIKSKIVCGLHVRDNLRLLRSVENIKKGNRYWPDMPDSIDKEFK